MGAPSAFETTRLNLSRLTVQGRQELERGLAQAALASAHAIKVARVGIWFLSTDGLSLTCACQFGPDGRVDSSGAVLPIGHMPRYSEALSSRRVVMAHDARTAPETSELTETYLEPNGITSMLDAPIYRFGEVVGVACHEHVGPPRTWSPREGDLAASVADIVAVLLEQASRMDAEVALRAHRERAEKLERTALLSRFAAGIAHDFNNVLTAMVFQLEVIGKAAGPSLREELSEFGSFIGVGKDIVAQLMAYCKEAPYEPRDVDLVRLLTERRRLLEAASGARHRLSLRIGAKRAVAHGDPTRLSQLVLNLITNAREAMPDGGEIVLSLDLEEDWIALRVADRGVGIEDGVRERIFEPFFTTKGSGTGLGLSTVLSIVQQHDGRIEVESEVGSGTTFIARFPRVG